MFVLPLQHLLSEHILPLRGDPPAILRLVKSLVKGELSFLEGNMLAVGMSLIANVLKN